MQNIITKKTFQLPIRAKSFNNLLAGRWMTPCQSASESEKLLAQKKNLNVTDNQMALFSSPDMPPSSTTKHQPFSHLHHNIFQHVCKAILGNFVVFNQKFGRCNAIMVRVLYTGVTARGSSLGWGHCVVALGTLSASLNPGV